MKKIFYSILTVIAAFNLVSCMQVDNWDEPEATIHGTIYDAITGNPILTDQGNVQLQIWERSFANENVSYQTLNVKNDGTYNNERLFPGTYDMLAYNGSWWPCDTIFGVKIGNSNNASQDFKVLPYLQVTDFQIQYCPRHKYETDESGNITADLGVYSDTKDANNLDVLDTLRLKCRLAAPVTENLPQVWEVRSFISNTQYCGSGNTISYYSNSNDEELDDMYGLSKGEENKQYYTFTKLLKQNWEKLSDEVATPPMTTKIDEETGDEVEVVNMDASPEEFKAGMAHSNRDFVIRVPVKRGYKYSVRMGANVNDQYKKYNYSDIKVIEIPTDPSQTPSWSENF